MKTILLMVLIVVVSVAFILALNYGLTLQERSECLKWKDWATEYTNFYLTNAEQAQCDALNIQVFSN